MRILFNLVGKRYNQQWIFKDVSYSFMPGVSYAITGNNGSGKSTFIQCLMGAVEQSKGTITYSIDEKPLDAALAFNHFSFAAPYLELVEEMTLLEMLSFHQKFKPFYNTITIPEIIQLVQLNTATHKKIINFSSGMKQRLKLALAFFSISKVLLLDEPTSNLDADGIAMYQQMIQNYLFNRTVIISSNDIREYSFCSEILSIEKYK